MDTVSIGDTGFTLRVGEREFQIPAPLIIEAFEEMLAKAGGSPPPKCCLVKGCENHSSQGKFIGGLCLPCHTMLTTGKLRSGATFIHDMQARLHKIIDIAT